METSKRFQIRSNVTLRVLDKATGRKVQEHKGHNTATNTLMEGIGHYLIGDGVLRQGYSMLSRYVPRYISLGTMGLANQNEDSNGLPEGISGHIYTSDEATNFSNFMKERPGYGSDGYSLSYNNGRPYFGLGPAFTSFSTNQSYYKGDVTYYKGVAYVASEDMIVDPDRGIYNYWNTDLWDVSDEQPTCYELITPSAPRVEISFRDVVPEYESENPKTIDIIYSAMISTDSLAQFRESDKDYIFITESGLWADSKYHPDGKGLNSLLAGYRVAPPSRFNWYMKDTDVPDMVALVYLNEQGVENPTSEQIASAKLLLAEENRSLLKEQVLRVERDQVVQVIWKIEIGNLEDIGELSMSWIPSDIRQLIEELQILIETSAIYSDNITVPPSRWVSSDNPSYPFAASINVSGVNSTYFSVVQFRDSDVQVWGLAPESDTTENYVTIYSRFKPDENILIPIIMCSKRTHVTAS